MRVRGEDGKTDVQIGRQLDERPAGGWCERYEWVTFAEEKEHGRGLQWKQRRQRIDISPTPQVIRGRRRGYFVD